VKSNTIRNLLSRYGILPATMNEFVALALPHAFRCDVERVSRRDSIFRESEHNSAFDGINEDIMEETEWEGWKGLESFRFKATWKWLRLIVR
jgi:hypothetical protein